MSLKAGRVGVNPSQVDPVDGSIKSSATGAYTKAEADAKFETKSDATTALAAKQPINLVVPIEMLSGTKLTVESALTGLNSDKCNNDVNSTTSLNYIKVDETDLYFVLTFTADFVVTLEASTWLDIYTFSKQVEATRGVLMRYDDYSPVAISVESNGHVLIRALTAGTDINIRGQIFVNKKL